MGPWWRVRKQMSKWLRTRLCDAIPSHGHEKIATILATIITSDYGHAIVLRNIIKNSYLLPDNKCHAL